MHNVCQGAHIVPCRVSAVHARAVYVHCTCLMLTCASTANSTADLVRSVAREAGGFPVVAREAGARFTGFFMAPCGACLAARAPCGLARRACCCRFLFARNACFLSAQSSSSPSSVDALWAHAAHTFFLPVQAGVRVEVTRRTRNYTSRHAVRYAAACRFAAEAPSNGAAAIRVASARSCVVDLLLDAVRPARAHPTRGRNRMFAARKGRRLQAHKQQQQQRHRNTHGRHTRSGGVFGRRLLPPCFRLNTRKPLPLPHARTHTN